MKSSNNLQGKVAFVQGGSRGIGAAIVKRLASDGAAVAFTYVSSEAQSQLLVDEVLAQGGGKSLPLRLTAQSRRQFAVPFARPKRISVD